MATNATVRRNTAVVTEALAKGKRVRFTYTTAAGDTARRTIVPTHVEATRHNENALVVRAKDGLNDRSFRTDRMLRAMLTD
jgi:predicted DNA-binding transcriptional regulator YafY